MADLVEMKSAMAQMQEQLRELTLAMHQLNSPTHEKTRIAKSGDLEMIGAASTSAPNHIRSPIVQHLVSTREPRIALPEKFDGTRSKFRGFINQVQLAIELQPQSYPTPRSQVRFIGTLLSGPALSWFSSFLERQNPTLDNLGAFLAEFRSMYGEHDAPRVATNKNRILLQGNRSVATYASQFRQLAIDTEWDDTALISQFVCGLQHEVKKLMLNLPDPQTLSQAIGFAVKCDNLLFEVRSKSRTREPQRYCPMATSTSLPNAHLEVEGMHIDAVRFKPLTEQEKIRRRQEGLCLYCGEPKHIAQHCPKKQRNYKMRGTAVKEDNMLENGLVQLQ
jgi:hypothetical protein